MKAFGYIRVSTEEQEKGYSLEYQEQTIKEYCQKRNIELLKVFQDTSSGANFQRKELQELLNNLNEIDTVIVWKMDRLSRSVKDTIRIMEIFEEQGKELISISEPFLSVTGDGKTKLMIHLFSSFSQYERDLIRERTLIGKLEKAKKGLVPAGRSAYGYFYKNGDFEIIEEEAQVVRLIFNKYIEIQTFGGVAKFLNENGYRTRTGKMWGATYIRNIINNPIYIGIYTYNKKSGKDKKINSESEWIKIENENWKIIDNETFNKAQEIYKSGKKFFKESSRLGTGNSLFGGLIKCGVCGYSMTIRGSVKYNSKLFYKCKSKVELGIDCGNDVVYENFLEEGIIELIEYLANLSKNDIYKEILNITTSSKDNEALRKIDIKIKEVKSLIEKYSREFESLLLKGINIPDALAKKLNEYENTLKELQKERDNLLMEENKIKNRVMDWEEFIALLSRLRDILEIASAEDKKALYKSFIDKIIYRKGKVTAVVKDKEFEVNYKPRILDLSQDDIEYLKSFDTNRAKILLLANQTHNRNEIAEKLGVSQYLVDYVISKWKAGRKTVVKHHGEPKKKKSKAFPIVKEFVEKHNIDINSIPAYKLTHMINKATGLNLSEHSVRSSLYELKKKKKQNF